MITTLLLSLALATPPPTPQTTTERVLVLDLHGEGVDAAIPVAVRDTLVSYLQASDGLEVLSAEDMRRTLDVEAEKEALGCKADASCLAEVAGALGARFLLYGSAAKLGDVVAVNLSLYDARAGVAVARESIEINELGRLPTEVRRAAKVMFAQVGVVLPAEHGGPSPLVVAGGVAAGIGALAVIGCSVLALTSSSDVSAQPTFVGKQEAAGRRDAFAIGAAAGGVVVVAGAVVLGLGLAGE